MSNSKIRSINCSILRRYTEWPDNSDAGFSLLVSPTVQTQLSCARAGTLAAAPPSVPSDSIIDILNTSLRPLHPAMESLKETQLGMGWDSWSADRHATLLEHVAVVR